MFSMVPLDKKYTAHYHCISDTYDKYDVRYPEEIIECMRKRLGLDENDSSKDDEINKMSPDDVFGHVCEWNGIIGFADTIKSWIESIYNIELEEIS